MRKTLFTLVFLLSANSFAVDLIRQDGKPGRLGECYVDTDVDAAFSTTVNVTSNSGQAVLSVASTTGAIAGDILIVNPAGARQEVCTVLSVAAGVSFTCTTNLLFTHTSAQADAVVLTNRVGPVTGGFAYLVQLNSSTDTIQAGRFVVGDAFANGAGSNNGISMTSLLDTGVVVYISPETPYLSFVSQNSNNRGRACRIW